MTQRPELRMRPHQLHIMGFNLEWGWIREKMPELRMHRNQGQLDIG